MISWILKGAALLGASGVALGAFGAHGLAARFPQANLDVWDTAVSYHLLHALALLALAALPEDRVRWSALGFLIGVVLFSGSLYLLALGGPRWLGPVTPVGGLALIVGWLALLRAGAAR